MEVSRILQEIDAQIAKLQQARSLLSNDEPIRRGPGRPKGAVTVSVQGEPKAAAVSKKSKNKTAGKKSAKRSLSPEARKRIAEAQKKRWAESRKEKA